MAAVKQELDVVLKLNDQFSDGLRGIQRETSNTFDEKKPGSFLSGIKASTVALGALAIGGIVAVGAGLKSAFDMAREFEQSMADVKAITGATGEDFASLSKLAEEMGRTTAHSATAAAEGIQFLGMAGFDTGQIMDALPATLSLASAAGMELGAAADIASNILSGMGMKASDLDGVVDKLAQTGRNANTDVNQLGEAFKMVGPTAAAAGVDFDTTTTSLGLLANAGLQGGIGGSSLNSALRAMINPSKEAEREAKKLGLTFVDTNGKMLPMENILGQLEEKSVSTKESFKIFGTEGARAMNALRNQGSAAFRALDRKIKESGGVAQDMAQNRLGSFDGAVRMLKSAFQGFGITIGTVFLPIATTIINDFLIPAINKTNEFVEAVGGFGQMWNDVVDLIVGFKNTALNILSELFNNASFADEFLGNIGSIFSAAAGAIMTFAFGSPRMGGLGGAVGIIIELGKIIWEPLKQGFLAIWDFIKTPLVTGINWITGKFTDGLNAIITEWNNIGDKVGLAIELIDFTPLTVEPAKTFQERWTEGTDNVKASWTKVEGFAKDIGDNIGADIDNVTAAMAETADSAAHLVDEGMERVTTKWGDATDKMAEESSGKGEEIGKELGEGVEDGFKPELAIPVNTWDHVFEGVPIVGPLKEKFEAAFGVEGAVGEAIINGMNMIFQGEGFGQSIAKAAQGLGAAIGGPIGMAITSVATGVLGALAPASLVERKTFGGVAEELAYSVEQGGIGKFAFGTKEGKSLRRSQHRYRQGAFAQRTIREDALAEELQQQFGKDPKGNFYLNLGNATNLARALLSDEFYGERGQQFNQMIQEILVRSTADELIEDQRRTAFKKDIGERARERAGITAAQHGYSGMVSQPTLFLAGEAGPEMVNISPTSRMSGGFQGSGGPNFHFNFAVNTIDEQGVKEFIEEDARPFIVQMLQKESTRGASVMYQTGITTDPSV